MKPIMLTAFGFLLKSEPFMVREYPREWMVPIAERLDKSTSYGMDALAIDQPTHPRTARFLPTDKYEVHKGLAVRVYELDGGAL